MAGNLRADAARNRERVLEVARNELANGNRLQLNDIARKAGVGVGTVYRHFPTPHALLEAVFGQELAAMARIADDALGIDDPGEAFTFLLRSILELQLKTDGGLAAIVAAVEDAQEQTTQAKHEMRGATDELLGRAYQAGVVRRDISAEDILNLMVGLEQAVKQDPGRADVYLSVLLAGLRANQSG
ncbi:TetR/AcrR family transcriptional regulator [Kibdelosporangium persicum]|uniref:Transcriptional regulator n=1 Tax=Kibdelosporangium persicum TaxID=2698649 RepID=A0ABX2EWT9_9PSEU|nr:TetR/AcrR family transcriptional regulator [Kibdelosporangium persicum]NRN63275.1 Transcriptional regulator [Kibdelosporangium persicum]